MKKIMLIEDDAGLCQIIGDRLCANGYDFFFSTNGREGLSKVLKNHYDLLLLDLMLTDVSGYDILREIRSHGVIIPVIILSAKFRKIDKIQGFRLGADDYLVKPFDFDELQVRIEAHIRRDDYNQEKKYGDLDSDQLWSPENRDPFSFDSFLLDFKQCELFFNNTVVPLSKVEFRLLSYLIINRERVVSYSELLEKVWNYDENVSSRTLYVHAAWLRKKINSFNSDDEYIRTVRGIGYQFIN